MPQCCRGGYETCLPAGGSVPSRRVLPRQRPLARKQSGEGVLACLPTSSTLRMGAFSWSSTTCSSALECSRTVTRRSRAPPTSPQLSDGAGSRGAREATTRGGIRGGGGGDASIEHVRPTAKPGLKCPLWSAPLRVYTDISHSGGAQCTGILYGDIGAAGGLEEAASCASGANKCHRPASPTTAARITASVSWGPPVRVPLPSAPSGK